MAILQIPENVCRSHQRAMTQINNCKRDYWAAARTQNGIVNLMQVIGVALIYRDYLGGNPTLWSFKS